MVASRLNEFLFSHPHHLFGHKQLTHKSEVTYESKIPRVKQPRLRST